MRELIIGFALLIMSIFSIPAVAAEPQILCDARVGITFHFDGHSHLKYWDLNLSGGIRD
jgi:hypothetical protein